MQNENPKPMHPLVLGLLTMFEEREVPLWARQLVSSLVAILVWLCLNEAMRASQATGLLSLDFANPMKSALVAGALVAWIRSPFLTYGVCMDMFDRSIQAHRAKVARAAEQQPAEQGE